VAKAVTKNPVAEVTTISDQDFHDENSGRGALSSQVTFKELGIKERQAVQIVIHHPDADITGGTIQIPGDRVWIKGPDAIVFAACGVYFEARRTKPRGRN
jgi:hypothetical protein